MKATFLGRILLLALTAVPVAPQTPKAATSAPPAPPDLAVDFERLAAVRERLRAAAPQLAQAAAQLRADATKLLGKGPYSVVDKEQVPPSGDKHDYMSVGPYWWPNPDTDDGLPYVRRDGEGNPERRQIPDASNWNRMASEAHTLALAGYLLDEPEFSRHAALLLRTWFLAPKTRMNPHLRFGQAIPGRVDGRDIGLIDTRKIYLVTDAAQLLDDAVWPASDQEALRAWCREFLTWMVEGPFQTEGKKRNNHGTWYDVQVIALAAFVGDDARAKKVATAAQRRRIAAHVAPSGEQPEEVARTDGWAYSVMNLHGLCVLATLGERQGVDLWSFETDDRRSIRQAFAYLAPFLGSYDEWPHGKLNSKTPARAFGLFAAHRHRYRNEPFAAHLAHLPQQHAADRLHLLVPSIE